MSEILKTYLYFINVQLFPIYFINNFYSFSTYIVLLLKKLSTHVSLRR